MTIPDEAVRAIRTLRPDLAEAAMTAHHDGWDCLAVEVAGWIFKFPRSLAACERLKREAEVLRFAAGASAVPLPRMRYHDAPPPLGFSEHRKIEGEALDPAAYARLGPAARDGFARQIADTFVAFHRVPVARARRAGCPEAPCWPAPAELLAHADAHLDRRLFAAAQRTLAARERYGADRTVFGHFDTHGWNMAVDLDRCRLNGLFDFGHSGVGPLHRDLSYPCFVDVDLAARVARQYEAVTGRAVDLGRILNAHATLRLVELAEASGDRAPFVAAIARTHAAMQRLAPPGSA